MTDPTRYVNWAAYAIMGFGIAYAAYSQWGGGSGGTAVKALGLLFAMLFVLYGLLRALEVVNVDKYAPRRRV